MKHTLALAAGLTFGLALSSAQAADPVTIQLKWVSQAQFAGYFVARDKGFYKEPARRHDQAGRTRTSPRRR
jgi:ABC-type nitrate/sulfonate/bicarbonate transport systems, periplasmic components